MNKILFWNSDFGRNNVGNKCNYVFGGILFSGSLGRNICPLALDVFFERSDFGVIKLRQVYACPFGDILHQNPFLTKFSHDSIKVKELAVISPSFNAEQLFKRNTESGKIGFEILFKGLVVVTDA